MEPTAAIPRQLVPTWDCPKNHFGDGRAEVKRQFQEAMVYPLCRVMATWQCPEGTW